MKENICNNKKNQQGFSLMEILVSLFVVMILTLGVYNLIILSLQLTSDNKKYVEAIEIANQKMERIRNMPYDDVGVVAGIPSGSIPQVETIQREGEFTVNTYVTFFDDPYDGQAGSSTNPDTIITDYKIASIKVSWKASKGEKNITTFSKIIPRTEETTSGFGLLKIYVVNSNGNPISGATVRVINNSVGPVDVTNVTNSDGILYLPAYESFQSYEIVASSTGYGVDKTYAITAENPNPTKKHLSVIEGDKTEETFVIDKLGTVNIHTVTDTLPDNWQANSTIASTTNHSPNISIDSSDNLYITWQTDTSTSSQVYVQKFDSNGSSLWAQQQIISNTQFQTNSDIVTSNSGESFVIWQDNSATLKSITYAPQTKLALKINDRKLFNEKNHFSLSIMPSLDIFNTSPFFVNNVYQLDFKPFLKDIFDTKVAKAAGPITFVGAEGATTGNNWTIQIDVPAATQENDFMLAYVHNDRWTDGPILPPAGWSTLEDNIHPSAPENDHRGGIFYKIASDSEPSNYTFTLRDSYDQKAGHIRVYRGVDLADPFDGSLEISYTEDGDQIRPAPSHTVSEDGSILVCGWGVDTRTLGENSPTFPTGMTNSINNYADYITTASADLSVDASDSPTGEKNYDANTYVHYTSFNWSLVLKPEASPDNITVSSINSQNASSTIPSTDEYIGGAFVLTDNTGTHNVSKIRISENGTVDALNNLSQIKLFYDYDLSAPYDCQSETFNSGSDPQFGTASSSFSANDGYADFIELAGITMNQTQSLCFYVVLDISSGAQNNETIEIEIENPPLDVAINTGSVLPSGIVTIADTTSLLRPAEVKLDHYRFRQDDGNETSATWDNFEDAQTTITNADTLRLRLALSNTGGIDANPMEFKLEYSLKNSSCAAASTWSELPTDNSMHWKIIDSTNLNDSDPSTNLSGLSDPATTFIAGEIKDTSNQTSAITLTTDSFTEIEFSISPTSNVTDTAYCFRVSDAGVPDDITYNIYPELAVIGDNNIYIKALNTDGTEKWAVKRVNTDIANEAQQNPKIALTENIGDATTTVIWEDLRNGNSDIYAMSFDRNGNKLWGSDLQITSSSTEEYSADIIIDSSDNIFVAWVEDSSISQDIFLQKINLSGTPLWTNPKAIVNTGFDEYNPKLALDASGNIILTWEEDIAGVKNIGLKQLNSSGIQTWDIQPNLDGASYDQENPSVFTDTNYIYVAWTDSREGNEDIYVQKYDTVPNAQWSDDLKINTNSGSSNQLSPKLIINSTLTPFSAWEDLRNGNSDIYATQFDDPLALNNAPNIPLLITGTKRIGESPVIYEYSATSTTDSSGQLSLQLEWDVPGYTFEIDTNQSSDSIKMRDPIQPLELLADETKNIVIYID